jgi:hypothetical protein
MDWDEAGAPESVAAVVAEPPEVEAPDVAQPHNDTRISAVSDQPSAGDLASRRMRLRACQGRSKSRPGLPVEN